MQKKGIILRIAPAISLFMVAATMLSGCGMAFQRVTLNSPPDQEQLIENQQALVLPTNDPAQTPAASPASTDLAQPTASESPAVSPSASPTSDSLEATGDSAYDKYRSVAYSAKMKPSELTGDNGDYGKVTYPPTGTYKLVVDLTNQAALVYEKDSSGKYTKLIRAMICTTGKPSTRTPSGTFKMGASRVRFGFFKDYNCYAQYWSQVVRSIYIHTILYSRRNAKYLLKNSYNNLGRAVSHGCIRMLVPDARWIYNNMAPGSTVEIKRFASNPDLRKAVKPPKL